MKSRYLPIVAVASFALASTPSFAHGNKASNQQSGQQAGMSSQSQQQELSRIFNRIHQINLHEIQAGKLAESKGSTEQVRTYGKKLADDHDKADRKLMDLAKKKNVSLAGQGEQAGQKQQAGKMGSEKEMRQTQKLQSLSGPQFDREFLKQMRMGHSQAIKFVQKSQDKVQDKDVKDYLSNLLPELQEHDQTANKLIQQAK